MTGFFWRTKKEEETKQAAPTAAEAVAVPTTRAVGGDGRVLVRPIVSEKAAALNTVRQYVFEVAVDATKHAVRDAVEAVYGVRPERVNIARVRRRQVRWGRTEGMRKSWKKATVTLPEGKSIQVYEGV